LAKAYKQLPSIIYHIDDDLAAAYLDRAVATFGRMVDAEIEQASKTAKNEGQLAMSVGMVVHKWIGQSASGQFRTPAPTR
jgi:hypothetical protein